MAHDGERTEITDTPGRDYDSAAAFDPIRDPFLDDDLRHFQAGLKLLAPNGTIDATCVRELCRLSRDIMFRTYPARECPRKQLELAIHVFRETIDLWKVLREHPQNQELPKIARDYFANIEERLETLVQTAQNL